MIWSIGLESTLAGKKEKVWRCFHENMPGFSSSSHLVFYCPLSHMSFFPDTCLPLTLVSPSCLLLCWAKLFVFFGGLFMGGRNTLLLQASSSLSAHHTKHDRPPSLWCWDELFLLLPHRESFFYFSASLSPSWTSLQDSGSIESAQANSYLLWALYTNIV